MPKTNPRASATAEALDDVPPRPDWRRWSRRALARSRREINLGWRAAGRGVVEFYRSENLTFAASIAYYALLSTFPFLLLVLTILSRLAVGGDGPSGQTLLAMITGSVPSNFEFLVIQVQELARTPLRLSLAGTIVTLWASMGVFGAVTSAVNHAWGVEKSYGFFTHKLIAFLMMLAAGALAVVALTLVSASEVVDARWFSDVLVRFPELQRLSSFLYDNAATLMFILVVGLIYYFVPNAQVRLRDVWFGAILAGLLWRGAFAGFAGYVRDSARFSVHGSVAAVVAFLLWIYLSTVIVLYGVEVTAAYARLRKHVASGMPAAPVRQP